MSARTFDINKPGRYGNVTVYGDDLTIKVKLHNTIVVSYDKRTKMVTLNSGGWRTMTTKTAINNALSQLGFFNKVYQYKNEWYFGDNNHLFEDEMKIGANYV